MKKEFVVIDADNLTSWNAKTESAETFKTLRAAEKRASDLAKSEPGKVMRIFALVATAQAPVGPVGIRKS